ncbi:Predicted arabinose efflux permease, MFS family [Jatrophihabitans endophyticus]|uniref:Predicted arabinose efflux permease, MFS family n=1 Tax=Jatrophihabitans endophyticus TaxID=1206085 RepID=A0A1M5MIK1_9ACTN|nr:MFS transporter [Jatrophihabitans endophyticus]SHG76759.1 Predicted arabinose efflux permease, MFS family [Jatrophihabitans endophyticus]
MRSPLRELPVEVRALTGVGFMVALGFGLVAPALPLFAREFGVGRTLAGLVVSAFALTRLLMAPVVGRLVDALGERVLLASGIGIVAVSSLLAGFSQTYWQLLVLRGAGGAGSIMFSVAAASLLVRVTPDHLRGRAQGVWAGSFLLGMIAGPAVGTVATFSLRAPFFLYAGTLLVAGTIGLTALRGSELAERRTQRSAPLTLGPALRNRSYRAALAAAFAGGFAIIGARTSIVPQYVTDELGLDHGWAYAAFLVTSLVSGALLLPLGRLADTRGRRPVVAVGLLVAVAGFVVLPTAPAVGGLVVAAVLLGVAGAADSVGPGAMMGDVVGGRGGTVVALFQMSGDLGAVLGPVIAGWVADGGGYGSTFALNAVVCALPLLLVAIAPETLRDGRAAAGVTAAAASPADTAT